MDKLRVVNKSNSNTSSVKLDNGVPYLIERLPDGEVLVSDQTIRVKEKIETVTIDYKNYHMIGFQFRKQFENIQYRWFNINTKNKILTNSDWGNI